MFLLGRSNFVGITGGTLFDLALLVDIVAVDSLVVIVAVGSLGDNDDDAGNAVGIVGIVGVSCTGWVGGEHSAKLSACDSVLCSLGTSRADGIARLSGVSGSLRGFKWTKDRR